MKTYCCGRCLKLHVNIKLEIDQEGNEFMVCPTYSKRVYRKNEKNDSDVLIGPKYAWESEMYTGYNARKKK